MRRRVAERHLSQPGAHRVEAALANGDELQIGKFKLVFFLGAGRRLRVVMTERTPPLDRGGPQPPAGGVPRHHHLQDPVPREPGPARPRAHAVGLPQVLRRRHRAAAVDPAPAARELPAAEGHQGSPGLGRLRVRRPRGGARRWAPNPPTASGAERRPTLRRSGDGAAARARRDRNGRTSRRDDRSSTVADAAPADDGPPDAVGRCRADESDRRPGRRGRADLVDRARALPEVAPEPPPTDDPRPSGEAPEAGNDERRPGREEGPAPASDRPPARCADSESRASPRSPTSTSGAGAHPR